MVGRISSNNQLIQQTFTRLFLLIIGLSNHSHCHTHACIGHTLPSFIAHSNYICCVVVLPIRAVMMLAWTNTVEVKLLYSLFVGCKHSSVRLVGSSPLKGRLEVCVYGVWGRVCNSNFDAPEATMVCRQLGYSSLGN